MRKFVRLLFLLLFCFSVSHINAQKVGLVLSGGGAKGLAHVGVIRALEENGIPIDYITGTSMGAIVGALYAIGYTPDEMEQLFASHEFYTWYTGQPVEYFTNYALKMDEEADIISLKFDFRNKALKWQLPTNIISPYQMDLAFLKIFAAPSAAAGEDFNKLFVPFRCVSTDVNSQQAYIAKKGDLGTAVRASMTFPLVFKAVVLDSMLLFDGGMYNNFPQDVMMEDFSPDFIIGSKCADNLTRIEEDDIINQLTNMVMQSTDYNVDIQNGIRIESRFTDINLLDFHRLSDITKVGYDNTISQIDEIKAKVTDFRSPEQLAEMRTAYRESLPELRFKNVYATGKINSYQADYIRKVITDSRNREFDYDQLEENYLKFIGTDLVTAFFPTPGYDSIANMFSVKFRTVPSSRFRIAIGGNISSSNAQQGFVGLEFKYWKRSLTRTVANLYYGRLYTSAMVGIRRDYPWSKTFFYEAYGASNQFDYYSGSPEIFVASLRPSYLKTNDYHFRAATGVALNNNTPLRVGFAAGKNISQYYQTVDFLASDNTDKSRFWYKNISIKVDRNTLNCSQFPTNGRHWFASARYIDVREEYVPGSTSHMLKTDRLSHDVWALRIFNEKHYRLNKRFSIGYLFDGVYSSHEAFSNYFSTILLAPAFQPTVHSKTIFINEFRADTYLGVGVIPSVFFSKTIYLQAGGFGFQPYRSFVRNEDNTVSLSEPLAKREWMTNASVVWSTPVGPLSFSANYYRKNDTRWYFVLNFGFILFNRSGIEY